MSGALKSFEDALHNADERRRRKGYIGKEERQTQQ